MARKTNKTDHVLNLLVGTDPGGEKEEKKPEEKKTQEKKLQEKKSQEQKPQEKQGRETVPDSPSTKADKGSVHVVLSSIREGDPVAGIIKEKLEEEFEKSEAAQSSVPSRETPGAAAVPEQSSKVPGEASGPEQSPEVPETASVPKQSSKVPETAFVPKQSPEVPGAAPGPEPSPEVPELEPDPETIGKAQGAAPGPEMSHETPEAAPGPEQSGEARGLDPAGEPQGAELPQEPAEDPEPEEMEGYVFYNIMEKIVKDKAMKYMTQFGNCTCKRCEADTIALALSKLPPKYVVVKEDSVSPLVNFYEDHYAGQIIVEITKACIVVNKNPRHQRK